MPFLSIPLSKEDLDIGCMLPFRQYVWLRRLLCVFVSVPHGTRGWPVNRESQL